MPEKKLILIKPYLQRALLRLSLFLIFGIFAPILLVWATIAIQYSTLPGETFRYTLSLIFAFGSLLMFFFMKNISKALMIFAGVVAVVLLGWLSISPSTKGKVYLPGVAVQGTAQIDGNIVKVKKIRNFKYKSNTDYKIAYFDKTYDLNKLEGVDLFVSHWDGLEAIAHTFLGFYFSNGDTLCVSVEVRREQGEEYSTMKGFLKQFELIYVLSVEQDIVRVRTNFRGEETFLYPLKHDKETSQKLLVSLLHGATKLVEEPKFYNTVGQNCTTTLAEHFDEVAGRPMAYHTKILLNGFSDQFAYERGMLPQELPFFTLKDCCYITDYAKTLPADENFGPALREYVNGKIEKKLLELKSTE